MEVEFVNRWHVEPVEVPVFRRQTAAWKQFIEEQEELDRLSAEAIQRHQQATADVSELQQRWDELVDAAARGDGDPPQGSRPECDPGIAQVANVAHQRAESHRRDEAKVTADVAEEVVEAARAWWADQSDEAKGAIRQAQQYLDALNQALAQVSGVRRAQDGERLRRTGEHRRDGLAARTAGGLTLDQFAAALETGADPFELRTSNGDGGRVQRDGPGVVRWSEPAPDPKEPADGAPPVTDPVRAWL